ncbi:GNAT family N-acetyltransferase, partial [Cohnella suwonensis]
RRFFMINLKGHHDLSEVSLLLAECMWSDSERILQEIDKYKADDSRELYGKVINNELVGLIGLIHISLREVELKHIAIRSDNRRQGIGKQMINEIINKNGIDKIIAETDKDAVNFYRNIGFEIMSLGEKYPGIERFQCILFRDNKII